MPQYELRNYKTGAVTVDETGSASIPCGVITGVVGDTYGFIQGDSYTVTITNFPTKTGLEISNETTSACAAFVAQKYPNT